MFHFLQKETLDLCSGEMSVFKNIRPWVRGEGGEPLYLSAVSVGNDTAEFADESGKIALQLSVVNEEKTAALRLKASYHPVLGDTKGQNHLDVNSAAGFDFDRLCTDAPFMINYLLWEFWCETKICKDATELQEFTQSLLAKSGEDYLYLLTTCDEVFKSNLCGTERGGRLYVYANYPQDECDLCALILGENADPYVLPTQTAEMGLRVMHKKAVLRGERKFPETLEYLGWCSWDAFHMDVTHEGLLQKAAEFKEKNIPVRWVLIDDMWAECHNNNRETMSTRELYHYEADPARFPQGLKGCITDLKSQYGLKVGMWYPTTGYWHGIDPTGPIAEKHGDLLTVSVEAPKQGELVPAPDFQKQLAYFRMFNTFFKDCGADFVKVDNQGFLRFYYRRLAPIGRVAAGLLQAVEQATEECFDGTLINCMGMPSECFWNRPRSMVSRISGDFQPENRKWFIQHLIQCSFNAYAQGSLYTGDWDMWWSDDAQSMKNAVLRAMSGGPVYMSDELNRSIRETIMPIVYKDGRIIRLNESARPVETCLLADPQTNGEIYKVFNRIGEIGVIAAFNLDEKEQPVSGTVGAADLYGAGHDSYLLVDYFGKTAKVLQKGEAEQLTLKHYDDFRLYFLIPCNAKVLPIGLADKYMSPATFVTNADDSLTVFESGTFMFFSESADARILCNGKLLEKQALGGGLYTVELPQTDGAVEILFC